MMATREQMEEQLEHLIDAQVKEIKRLNNEWMKQIEEAEKVLLDLIDRGIAVQ